MPALIGHASILRELTSLAAREDPPHALLFAGPDGVGRTALAIEYARLLNCERLHPPVTAGASLFGDDTLAAMETAPDGNAPCGECRQCRLIEDGGHPDIITLGPGDALCKPRDGDSHPKHPDSRDIRICQVRGLIDLASRYPFEARYRMVIIDPADRLYREGQAAHTILKTLEEPPGHTVFALITAAPESLLETILSRCRRIDVPHVARGEVEAGLVARGIDRATAVRAADASHGRPGLALRYTTEPDLIGKQQRLLETCARVAGETLAERFRYASRLAERYRDSKTPAESRAAVLDELDAWEAFWEERLREAAAGRASDAARGALAAITAVRQAREDLTTNVMPRSAFELMLITFPRVTLPITREEEPAAYA